MAGLAIENTLKGAIVDRTPKEQRTLILTHDLVKLDILARTAWDNPAEIHDMLRRLTTFVKWAGRYPVAAKKDETQEPRILKSDDPILIHHVAVRLMEKYNMGRWTLGSGGA
jgi:hypothetical protein